MNWESFTPIEASIGGILIGLAATWMLAAHGRIAGISGIFGGLITEPRTQAGWRLAFVLGLLLAGILGMQVAPGLFDPGIERGVWTTLAAGLAVGFGTRLGGGCTSGHGVCGIGRLSPRSLVATGTFMATGALTVFLYNMIEGN